MDEAFERLIARERARLEEMGALRRYALARVRDLRAAIRAARQRGEHGQAATDQADLRTIVTWLWWLRRQERELVTRVAFLLGTAQDDDRR